MRLSKRRDTIRSIYLPVSMQVLKSLQLNKNGNKLSKIVHVNVTNKGSNQTSEVTTINVVIVLLHVEHEVIQV